MKLKNSKPVYDIQNHTEPSLISEGLVTIKEAGRILSFSRSTLYQMMERGELHYAKIGGSRRIPRLALKGLAQDCLLGGSKLLQSDY
ncbi:MAG: helix-turn-helix domain-containing protein [Myxococcaceae bacterium]